MIEPSFYCNNNITKKPPKPERGQGGMKKGGVLAGKEQPVYLVAR